MMLAVAGSVADTRVQTTDGLQHPQPSNSPRSKSPDDLKLRKAAGDFEAMLLNSLWKSMKETFSNPDDQDSDPTLESFDDWGMQAMSSAIGSAGGLGIKDMIINNLEPKISIAGLAAHQAP